NDLRNARRLRRADDDFSAVLLFEPQRFFERVGIRLVHLVAGVLFANPGFRVVEAWLPLARGNLFDANGYFHQWPRRSTQRTRRSQRTIFSARSASSALYVVHPLYLLNRRAAFVPPKPNEFDTATSIR